MFKNLVLLLLLWSCFAMEPDKLDGQTQDDAAAIARLLRDPFVQTDLELTPDQVKAWKSEGAKINDGLMELVDLQRKVDFGKATDRERQQVIESHKALYETAISKVESVFLPHQAKRFTQILWQMKTRPKGTSFGVLSLGDDLSITNRQREVLRELIESQDDEFAEFLEIQRKKLREKRIELRKSLLAKLNPQQRSKFEELVGDEFVHPLKSQIWLAPQIRDFEK